MSHNGIRLAQAGLDLFSSLSGLKGLKMQGPNFALVEHVVSLIVWSLREFQSVIQCRFVFPFASQFDRRCEPKFLNIGTPRIKPNKVGTKQTGDR